MHIAQCMCPSKKTDESYTCMSSVVCLPVSLLFVNVPCSAIYNRVLCLTRITRKVTLLHTLNEVLIHCKLWALLHFSIFTLRYDNNI